MKTLTTKKSLFHILTCILAIYAFSYGLFRLSGTCVYRLNWNNHVDQTQMIQDTDVTYEGIEFSYKVPVYTFFDAFYFPMKNLELIMRPAPEPLPLYEGFTRGHFAPSS